MVTFILTITTRHNGLNRMTKNTALFHISNNESGFIMVWSLLLLIVVTLLGVAGISTSIFEELMAVKWARHKQAV